jgi:glycosyltransferase involved in cell wall biosynthesis
MNICLFTMAWNEERMIPYFLRHYLPIVDKIVVFDHGSTDDTKKLLNHPKIEIRDFVVPKNSYWIKANCEVENNVWKNCQSNWVIICDIDELLYHPNLLQYLQDCQKNGVTIPKVNGFQMVHDRFPTTSSQIYQEVSKGVPAPRYSKNIIFNPNAIKEINYVYGAHECNPEGNVRFSTTTELKLLHFKNLGLDYVFDRYHLLAKHQGNNHKGYCSHWRRSNKIHIDVFNRLTEEAVEVI